MAITSRSRSTPRSRITRQGQITVPKAVREALGVLPGDELEFEIRGEDAVLHPRRRRSILEFAGIATRGSKRLPRTAAELDDLIERESLRRAARRLRP